MLRAPGPARARPRVRVGRARRRRHRRGAAAAGGLRAAADRREGEGEARRRRGPRGRARAGAARPAVELRPQGRRHSIMRDKPLGPPPLRRLQRVLRAVPRRGDDVLVRDLVARGRDAGGGAGDQARARVHEARAAARASACSTSAAAGARSPSTRRRARRPRHRHHAVRAAGGGRAGAGGDGGRRRPLDIRVMDYRELRGETFDAIASIGMVEHVGARQHRRLRPDSPACCEPGGRLLNHGIARLRFGEPEAGPFSERYVFPDAAPLHLSRVLAALEETGFETRPRRGLPAGLRPHAAGVAARGSTTNLDEAERLAGRSACACGRSTCAPPGAGSRPASRRSTRCWPTASRRATSRNEVTTIGSPSVRRQPGSPSSSATSSRHPA